jgi:predicted transcriptional regulator
MFRWTQQKENAAALLALGDRSYDSIAEELGTTKRTIINWLAEEEFEQRVKDNVGEIRKRVLGIGIADKKSRLERLNKRWQQIDVIFTERANTTLNISEPGFRTGLLNRTVTNVTKGDYTYVEEEYKPELGLLKEERELAKQAASELGEWNPSGATETDDTDEGSPVIIREQRQPPRVHQSGQ